MSPIQNYFFQLKNAVIDGDFNKTEMFLSFLNKFKIEQLKKELHEEWLHSYNVIKNNFSNNLLLDIVSNTEIIARDFKTVNYAKSQDELVNQIIRNPKSLFETLEIKNPYFLRAEFKTYKDERVDIVVEDKDCIRFPIEIKIQQADHETIGQIRKYCNFFWQFLSYGFYYKVQGVVIAGAFDKVTMRELKREGYITLGYNLYKDEVTFLKL